MSRTHTRLKSAFGFTRLPFDSNIGPDEYFVYPDFEKALERLQYVANRKGIATLTAPSGAGKSTLLRAFIESLGKTQFFPAYVCDTSCSVLELYKAIAYALDLEPSHSKIQIIRLIKERISSLALHRKITPILILDEAQILHRPFFDELRLLANFDADSSNLFMLLISGQPQLENSLRLSINEALSQRIIAKIKLEAFDRTLTEQYLHHRLQLAGRSAPLFAQDAIEAIWSFSNGISRLIDRVAETSLYIALQGKKKDIDLETVNLAIQEIDS